MACIVFEYSASRIVSLIVSVSSHSGHISTAICNVAAHSDVSFFFSLYILFCMAFRIQIVYYSHSTSPKKTGGPFLRKPPGYSRHFRPAAKATVYIHQSYWTIRLAPPAVGCAFVIRLWILFYRDIHLRNVILCMRTSDGLHWVFISNIQRWHKKMVLATEWVRSP